MMHDVRLEQSRSGAIAGRDCPPARRSRAAGIAGRGARPARAPAIRWCRCANRRGMLRELETMIARHERHGTPAAMLFVDLDDLKVLNDSFGHCGGDAALIMVAQKLLDGDARDRLRRAARRRRILRAARSCRREERAGNRRAAGRPDRRRGFHVRGRRRCRCRWRSG